MAGMENNNSTGAKKACPNPACQFDKHNARANFCILCGTLLYNRCEDCVEENPMYAKFCHYCGANLDDLRAERMQQSRTQFAEHVSPDPAPPETAEQKSEDGADSQETEDEKKKGSIFGIS